jgi:hypothetical protein
MLMLDDSLTVEQLIECLKKYPKNMRCFFTWESVFRSIEEENIYVGKENILLLDADFNEYKDEFEKKSDDA